MSVSIMAAPVVAVNPFDALIAWLRAFVGVLMRPGLTVFATSDAGGGEGGAGGDKGGGAGGAGAGGAGDEGGKSEDDDDLDDHAKLVADLGEKGAREVLRLRKESARYRKEAEDAKGALKTKTDADLTETQREKKRADEAEAKAKETEERSKARLVRAEIATYVSTVGVIDADAVIALVDRDDIEVDDDGNVKGVKKAVDTLLKEKPHLKREGGAGRSGTDAGGGSGEEAGKVDMNRLIRRSAGY